PSAGERGATEDHGQDGVQLDPQARVVGVGGTDVGADHQTGNARAQAREHVDRPDDGAGTYPGQSTGTGVDPDRLHEHPQCGPARDQGNHEQNTQTDEDGDRKHKEARADLVVERVFDGDDLTLGDEHRAPAPGRHQHQGGDDRLDAQDRNQETVPQTEQGAHTQGKEYRGERVPARDDPATGDRAGDGGHRPHGQVDTSGGDHQRHTDRDEQGRRTVAQDVDDTAVEPAVLQRDLEERGVVGRVCEKQQDQGGHRPEEVVSDELSRLHEATAVSCSPWAAMVAMTSSTVASVPLSSTTLRRSRSTTTRSDTRITSSSSEEMNSTAIPSAASSATIFRICALAPTSIPRPGSP